MQVNTFFCTAILVLLWSCGSKATKSSPQSARPVKATSSVSTKESADSTKSPQETVDSTQSPQETVDSTQSPQETVDGTQNPTTNQQQQAAALIGTWTTKCYRQPSLTQDTYVFANDGTLTITSKTYDATLAECTKLIMSSTIVRKYVAGEAWKTAHIIDQPSTLSVKIAIEDETFMGLYSSFCPNGYFTLGVLREILAADCKGVFKTSFEPTYGVFFIQGDTLQLSFPGPSPDKRGVDLALQPLTKQK